MTSRRAGRSIAVSASRRSSRFAGLVRTKSCAPCPESVPPGSISGSSDGSTCSAARCRSVMISSAFCALAGAASSISTADRTKVARFIFLPQRAKLPSVDALVHYETQAPVYLRLSAYAFERRERTCRDERRLPLRRGAPGASHRRRALSLRRRLSRHRLRLQRSGGARLRAGVGALAAAAYPGAAPDRAPGEALRPAAGRPRVLQHPQPSLLARRHLSRRGKFRARTAARAARARRERREPVLARALERRTSPRSSQHLVSQAVDRPHLDAERLAAQRARQRHQGRRRPERRERLLIKERLARA